MLTFVHDTVIGHLPLFLGHFQGYVDRDDVLIESLTVREMLYFSALLQLPGFLSSKKSIVEDAIAAMSLCDHADKLIGGNCFMKRLPTGERRRVSIARELVMRPHVLFIDEPLYNLDRYLSFTLRCIFAFFSNLYLKSDIQIISLSYRIPTQVLNRQLTHDTTTFDVSQTLAKSLHAYPKEQYYR
jgi:ABC-type ATPase involved in cell division